MEIFHKPNVLGGEEARVARSSMDQRVRAWRKGGFEALKPKAREASPKAREASPKVSAEVLAMAEPLRRGTRSAPLPICAP